MAWFHKRQELKSAVFFPGNMPLRAEDFAYLRELGIDAKAGEASGGMRWVLEMRHSTWGKAKLVCVRAGLPPLPKGLVQYSNRLTDREKETVEHANNGLYLEMEGNSGHILRDRKNLLRFGNAICGSDGIAMVDLLAMAFWTPAALQDELAHDADLDVQGIYALHCVTEEVPGIDQTVTYWAHTHGLQEIGRFDFDLIAPSEDALSGRTDFVRAAAFAVLEEKAKLDGEPFPIMGKASAIRFVSASKFMASGSGACVARYKSALDDLHITGHAVVCDAERTGLLGRLLGRGQVRTSRLAGSAFPDNALIYYSTAAGELMADRAQKTLAVFADWKAEFAEFEPTCIAKLRFQTAQGGNELPWFEVHKVLDDKVDATCINDPFAIKGLAKGDRAEYGFDRVTDWMIILPFAQLSPRTMPSARKIRDKREQLREVMREARKQAPGGRR
jgi:hypothetical protein